VRKKVVVLPSFNVDRLNLPDPTQYYNFVSKIPIYSNTRVEEAKNPKGKLRKKEK
jgi:hypothetical protein